MRNRCKWFLVLMFFAVSCSPKAVDPPKIVHEKGKYSVTECNSIIDNATQLEWFFGPDSLVEWDAQEEWLKNLKYCNGRCCGKQWRTPKINEVGTLFTWNKDKRINKRTIIPEIREFAGGETWSFWNTGNLKGKKKFIPQLGYMDGNTTAVALVADKFPFRGRPIAVRTVK